MKQLRIAALIAFATATMSAQDLSLDQVPANLKTKFSQSYTNVKDVEWEKKDNYYKVEFEINRMDHDIWYDSEGKVVKSKIEVASSELPSAVASAVKNAYPDYKIDSAEVLVNNGTTTYKVEIEKGWTKERNLIIDASGKIVSDIED